MWMVPDEWRFRLISDLLMHKQTHVPHIHVSQHTQTHTLSPSLLKNKFCILLEHSTILPCGHDTRVSCFLWNSHIVPSVTLHGTQGEKQDVATIQHPTPPVSPKSFSGGPDTANSVNANWEFLCPAWSQEACPPNPEMQRRKRHDSQSEAFIDSQEMRQQPTRRSHPEQDSSYWENKEGWKEFLLWFT